MLEADKEPPSEIALLLTDDEEVRDLNLRFRHQDSTTDVLSFPSHNSEPFLGDIVISVPQAQKQALQNNTPLHVELSCLAVHGGLHLLGYDHKTDEDREVMTRKMVEAVSAAGMQPNENWESLPH